MKFDTTLILAVFSLSAAAASDGKLIRGVASDLPDVPQDKTEVVMTAKRNVRVGGNIYKAATESIFESIPSYSQYCTASSCDDNPCGASFAPPAEPEICNIAQHTHLAKPCEVGKECEPCPGMHLKYICADSTSSASGDTTRTANTNTTNTNTTAASQDQPTHPDYLSGN